MTFKWQGQTYDTSKMEIFETGNPAAPLIYVVPNGEVFIIEIERLEGIEVRRVEREEAVMLSERYGFSHLIGTSDQLQSTTLETPVKQHALIVEDDGLSRHALSRLLNRSGYDIACAATVAEAETKLGDHPRWLILDLQLPDGRGTTLLERVRSENLPIKVAITTGETDARVLSHISRLRPDVIFQKPLNLTHVMHWLEAA